MNHINNRYLLWLRFNGSLFNGFASSGGNAYGVMDFLNPAMENVLAKKNIDQMKLWPCSRTDTGVHVLRAPIIMNIPSKYGRIDEYKDELLKEINYVFDNYYPNSMECFDFHYVSPGFCARKHARYRRYVYRLRVAKTQEWYEHFLHSPSIHCFSERFYSYTTKAGFNVEKANEACRILSGINNIASFMKDPLSQRRKYIKKLHVQKELNLVRFTQGEPINGIEDPHFDYYNFEVVSRSFVREQIRRMIRIIVKCGYEDRYFDQLKIMLRYPDPQTFIELGHRAMSGKGLYLVDVVYDKDDFKNPMPYMAQELDTYLNKVVSVITGDGRNFVGLMKGYDQTVNIILENSHERVYRGEQLGVEQVELGLYVVRGDNVAVIGELDEDLDRQIIFEHLKVKPLEPFWVPN
ncbi:unnamed protein product [Bursaphelenchus okinawaensis]|uniref:Sm domain-containing protein n=1 Tax=Bursaphelenchus okinawaensis TaxID=465554 RepID=A0A811KW93_9BILA|nr:unnamed protein product [Bursaphelenchus okinawaensis]CAG9112804.1 unnamed protein product [Bursaphelenchus okinawaensis]